MKKAGRFIANFLAVFIIVVLASVPVLYLFGYETCVVMSGSMEPAITTGSLCVIDRNSEYENISVGDVVAYDTGSMTVAHRAIGVTDEGVETKGDANESSDGISVTADNFVGTVRAYVPYIGYFFLFLQTVWGKAIIIAVVVLLLVAAFMPEKKKKPEKEAEPAEKGRQQELAEKDKQQKLAEASVQETADAEDTAPVVLAAAEASVQNGSTEGEGAEDEAEKAKTKEKPEAEQTETEKAEAESAEAEEKPEAEQAKAEEAEAKSAEAEEAEAESAETAEKTDAEQAEAEKSKQPAGKIAAAAVRPEEFAEESVSVRSAESAAAGEDISALPAEGTAAEDISVLPAKNVAAVYEKPAFSAEEMAGIAEEAEEKEKETAKKMPDVAALSASGSVYIESIEAPDEMKKKSAPLRVSGRVKTGDIAVSLQLSAESAGVPDGELPVRAVISVSSGSGSTCYIRIAAEYDGGKLSALPGGFGSYWMAADDGYWYYMKPLGDGTSVPAFRHIHIPEQLGKTDTVIFYTVTAQAVSGEDFCPDFAAENPWGIAEDKAETAESSAAAEISKAAVTAETGKPSESIGTGKTADAADVAESIGTGKETEAAEAAAETGKTADTSDAGETVSASDQDDKTVEKADLFVLNYEESAQEILDGQDSLFTEVKSFVPGASYEDTLTIQAKEITSLYFSGTALRPGSAYGNIVLTVTSEVRKRTRTRFCGPLSSDALKKGFTLTTLGIGETGKLTFTLQVPEDYTENTASAPEQIEWHFTGALC